MKIAWSRFIFKFNFVLNHLIISGNCRYIPIVDMEHFVTIYNEKNTVNNTEMHGIIILIIKIVII